MKQTIVLGMIISILASGLCQGCNDSDSHQHDQQRQIEGQIRIVQVRENRADQSGSPAVFLVTELDAFSLTFADDCVIEGLSDAQRGDGYPVTIGGKQVLLHSGGAYRISGRQEGEGLQLSTRNVMGFRVDRLVCTRAGEGAGYFELGLRDEKDRLFVTDGCITIAVDGDHWQMGGKSSADVPAPWARDPAVPIPVIAPFDGTLLSVRVQPGDNVARGEELLKVHSATLELYLAEQEASYREALVKENHAHAKGDLTESQVYKAQAESIAAQVNFLKAQLESAVVRSPVRGVVQSGGNQLAVDVPVQSRQVLFLVYPRP